MIARAEAEETSVARKEDRRLSEEARRLAGDPANVAFAGRVAGRWIRKLPNAPWLRDDIESAAHLGLCEAARTFDANRGLTFRSFAYGRLVGEIKDSLRCQGFIRGSRDAPAPKVESLDRTCSARGSRGSTLAELIPSDDDPVGWEVESADVVGWMTRNLPAHHRLIARMYFGECRAATMRETADILGLCETRIHQVIKVGCGMIRDDLTRRQCEQSAPPPASKRIGRRPTKSTREKREKKSALRRSRYFGIDRNAQTGKWRARIYVDGVRRSLGVYESEVDAARAYDRERLKYPPAHERAVALNFPAEVGAGV